MIAAERFSKDILEVDLGPDEMLVEIQVPSLMPYTGVAHEKLMVMQGDAGIVGAAVSIRLKPGDGICEEARIVISNAASVPLRVREAEKRLIGKVINDPLLKEAGEAASAESDPPSDVHASAAYRKEMVKVFVRRAAARALEKAKRG
jgi:carbon-monoxide dehydrogenase medium subunit